LAGASIEAVISVAPTTLTFDTFTVPVPVVTPIVLAGQAAVAAAVVVNPVPMMVTGVDFPSIHTVGEIEAMVGTPQTLAAAVAGVAPLSLTVAPPVESAAAGAIVAVILVVLTTSTLDTATVPPLLMVTATVVAGQGCGGPRPPGGPGIAGLKPAPVMVTLL
jgi:hypothetical protein